MFTGLSAFPLTPTDEERVDEHAFVSLVRRLAHAGVDFHRRTWQHGQPRVPRA